MKISDFENIGERVVTKALSLGVSAAEAFLTRTKDLTIEVSDQRVETLKLAEQQGMGVRVIKNNRLGFAFTSDLTDSAIDQVVHQAAANSASTSEDPHHLLPDHPQSYAEVAVFDPEISRVSLEEKIQLAMEIERVARETDKRVTITERSAYSDSLYEVTVVNSLGLKGSYQGAYCGAYALLVAEEKGEAQTGFGFQYRLNYRDLDPQAVARDSAGKAVRMLGAKSIATQEMPAVFDPYIATSFIGLLAPSLFGESIQKGKSRLAGKKGQTVASPLVTLVDDGAKKGEVMSAPFDGEGVPTGRTVLINQGVLNGFLYNIYTAAKEGTVSTGNGSRGSYMGTPETGTTNFYIENGSLDRDELIRQTGSGIYITDVMGMHTANPISGDFSLGASGLLIEKGEMTRPVRSIAIAGNIFDFLTAIDGVASDLTFFVGKGSPTLRVAKMTVSGS